MAITVQTFPNELLEKILSLVTKPDLKSARLVCLRWRDVGAKFLFQRVYIAPRKGPVTLLENITSHPVFSKSIKEVVYDGRLFEEDLLDEVRYRDRLREAHDAYCEWEESALDKITNGYRSSYCNFKALYHEQQDILRSFTEHHILHDRLARLPNVVKVVITDVFMDDLPARLCDHYCFNDSLSKELGRSFTPIGWTNWGMGYVDAERAEARGSPLDCRGISCLLHAMSLHTPRIAELQLGIHSFVNAGALSNAVNGLAVCTVLLVQTSLDQFSTKLV